MTASVELARKLETNERSIFKPSNGNAQVTETGVAGAKIIEDDANAQLLHFSKELQRGIRISQQNVLGYFDLHG